jgi:hypothetical protein
MEFAWPIFPPTPRIFPDFIAIPLNPLPIFATENIIRVIGFLFVIEKKDRECWADNISSTLTVFLTRLVYKGLESDSFISK